MTGNWGCGVFNGDIRLKFIIQWIACSLSGKKMTYVPFGNGEMVTNNDLIEGLTGKPVVEVYERML